MENLFLGFCGGIYFLGFIIVLTFAILVVVLEIKKSEKKVEKTRFIKWCIYGLGAAIL
ncbi:MAG: hypothetical protein AAB795_03250 [Patescibacteria group bacterium]